MSSFQIGISIDKTAWCFIVPYLDVLFWSLSSDDEGPKYHMLETQTSPELTL